MFRTALPLLFALATPVAAFDIDAMSAAERATFRAEIRNYLLENPEVLSEAFAILQTRQQQAAAAAELTLVADNAEALFNDGHSFVGGNPEGDITIVEFMDYRCGYCKRAFPEVATLLESDGNIRYIVKEFPILGEQSSLAARYAIATKLVAGDAAYEEVHNTLMEYRGDITPQSLGRLAETFDLDHDAIMVEMESSAVADIITANRALAERLQITGTPTFVVEDQMVRGYIPGDQMAALVTDLRDKE